MLNALSQSPITAQQFFEWDEKLQKDEILVREIIDIDTNYMEDENSSNSIKKNNEIKKDSSEKNEINMKKRMNLIQLLQLWKVKLNQKY